jgi:hypothetical protein
MTGTTSIHLYNENDDAEELVQFYSDVIPRAGDQVVFEMPRAQQMASGIATVTGEVERVSLTYRGKTVLAEVWLIGTQIEYVS